MERKHTLSLSVPKDVREWLVREAGQRRMTISDYAVRLMTVGIQAETIDKSVERITKAVEASGVSNELLRQVLATRYVVERSAKGEIKSPTTLGYDANTFADKELKRLLSLEVANDT